VVRLPHAAGVAPAVRLGGDIQAESGLQVKITCLRAT
jgi:hypothetical protein